MTLFEKVEQRLAWRRRIAARNVEIFERYFAGDVTMQMLGDEFGITRQAVSMIIKRHRRRAEQDRSFQERMTPGGPRP